MRTASLPVGGALVKETGDKRPVSAHSILNSVTRHSSLKTKVLETSHCDLFTCSAVMMSYESDVSRCQLSGGESTVEEDDFSRTLEELQ